MICKVAEAFSLKRQFGISGLITQEEIECEKCGGELKTLSAMVSDDERHYIKAVECKKCGHKATLKEPRIAPYVPIKAIV